MEFESLYKSYDLYKEKKLKSRIIGLDNISPLINNLGNIFEVQNIGVSEKGKEINLVSLGNGDIDILIWTQMHGNESTGTKAIFDLFNFFCYKSSNIGIATKILEECKIFVIPILNPDGANLYTRENAIGIDLNRDVIEQKAKETKVLLKIINKIKPRFCFNMHDQRTIFSIGDHNLPATLSFLAPSVNEERQITEGRKITMGVIAEMYNFLKTKLPNQIGRYTDEFYPSATGDNFQKMGYNTILIESGHFKGDYQREISRKYTFYALLKGIFEISRPKTNSKYKDYFKIPENKKEYVDILVKNITLKNNKLDIGIWYKEKLENNSIVLNPKIIEEGNLENFNADKIINGSDLTFSSRKKLNKWIYNEFHNKIED